jgi:fidgetin-like protein 1
MSTSPKSTTDIDVQVEEWEIRYRKLEESLDEGAQNDASFLVRSMIASAGRLGSLQLQTDPVGQALYEHVQHEISNDVLQRRRDAVLQKMAQNIPVTSVSTHPSPQTYDVDAFFDEYPECMRKDLADDCDEDESSSSEDEVQDITPQGREPKRQMQPGQMQPQHHRSMQGSGPPVNRPGSARGRLANDTISSIAAATPPVTSSRNNPYQKVTRLNERSPPGNFEYNPPPQEEAIKSSWDNQHVGRSVPPPSLNPYSYPQEQPYQTHPRPPPNSHPSSAEGPPSRGSEQRNNTVSTNLGSWEQHANYQQNPFFTAREVAQGMAGDPNDKGAGQRSRDSFMGASSASSNRYCGPPLRQAMDEPRGGGPSIPDSLRRKFQPPKRMLDSSEVSLGVETSLRMLYALSSPFSSPRQGNNNSGRRKPSGVAPARGGGVQSTSPSSASGKDEEDELPEELQHLDKDLVKKIQNEIMESGETITFDDIAGLEDAKQTVQEVVCWPMKRPDLFTGLRRAPNGLLLYGPPGTGKTLIGKAIAHESGATFFSISSSSLTSKWIGEGEKLVKTLFAVAAYREPAVVFIDEIDSLLTQRKSTENEASRRMKTEFLVQLDGTGTSGQGRVLVIGATNKPQELDEAARRRFTKRLYIPLPAEGDRRILLNVMLKKNHHLLTDQDIDCLAKDTAGFSGADLKSLCTDAAMGPIRQLGSRALDVDVNDVPAITFKHFKRSLKGTKPSVAPSDLVQYEEWDMTYGSKRATEDDDDDDE